MRAVSVPLFAVPPFAVFLTFAAGCGSSAPAASSPPDAAAPLDAAVAPPPPGDGNASDANASDAGVDASVYVGPACNDLAAAAPAVSYSLSDQAAPAAATGGAIADGTYYLTGYTIYGAGSVGPGFTANQATSITLEIAGSAWKQVQVIAIEGTTSTVSATYAATVSGASITLAQSCPPGAPTEGSYTATPAAIQLVTHTSGFVLSETFARQ